MPFALFTTLLGRVRLSQGNRWLYGELILHSVNDFQQELLTDLLILGMSNPIKLTWGSPCCC